jgi:hypothetical protein
MLTERDMFELLEEEPIELKPLRFERSTLQLPNVDVVYDVDWAGKQGYRFIADVKARTTSQALAAAAQRATSQVFDAHGGFPLIIVPYLSPSSLDEAERLGVSAVDLCGNGVVQVPQRWLVVRSGKPNRFRGSSPLSGAYRGVASLVGRSFAVQPRFGKVSDVLRFIEAKGSRIALATVSKALKRLEEDLVVARDASGLRLLQGDKLLQKLKEGYKPPMIRSRISLKTKMSEIDLHRELKRASRALQGRLVLSGISSARFQTVIAMEPIASFYCSMRPEELARTASIDPNPEKHFANLELLQTDDERVFFDAREIEGRYLASPVQTWLELASGDKRAQEVADSVRDRLLNETVMGARNG